MINKMKTGIYTHYKGKEYLVLGTARHSETQEKLVVYIPLYAHEGEPISVRPYEMFISYVVIGDSPTETESVKRFTYKEGQ
jgi:hypothetical protein